MRVKLVIMIRIAGASDTTVISATACMAPETFSFLARSGMENEAAAGAEVMGLMGVMGEISSILPWAMASGAIIAIAMIISGIFSPADPIASLLCSPLLRNGLHTCLSV